MILLKFSLLILACCAIYLCDFADYLTFTGILSALFAVGCMIAAIII